MTPAEAKGTSSVPGGRGALARAAELLGPLAHQDEPIGARTTYRVGGRAALFAEIGDEEALERVVSAVTAAHVEVLVLGSGSNMLVADGGFDGLCVSLTGIFDQVEVDASTGVVHAGGAARYPVLARQAAAAGCAGMGWAVGIPGSVGGAVRMNAGGHGAETADRLVSCRLVDLDGGGEKVVSAVDLGFGYRRSRLGPSEIAVSARFACEHGSDPDELGEEISSIVAWRRANQPGGRNAGSVFANPPGDVAGRLVEEAGLKGFRIGSAAVSDKHGNFVQADQGGSADDVRRVVEEVQRLVAARLGVELKTELLMVGFG